ncbi:MAG: bifunctional folylpolyglutamate synthase/dihydrofolate synthase, partial [Bacteroidales bacterium]
MTTYDETMSFLFARLPMYQRTGASAYKSDLAVTLALDEYFDHPHKAYRNIHVAGTNGKGSVSHILASVLQQAGYKVGLYTSPHYRDFRERIKINGEMIGEQEVMDFVHAHYDNIADMAPSFFEMTFAMAMEHFHKSNVDIVVWETGMGGRLDSTNIVQPDISVITNISLDHTQFLGNTIEEIAREKAGIIKDHVPVVIGEKQNEAERVFKFFAEKHKTQLYFASENISLERPEISADGLSVHYADNLFGEGELLLPLMAEYQVYNLKTALQVFRIFKKLGYRITWLSIYEGLKNLFRNTGFKGRFQILGKNPLILADSGHNEAAVNRVMEQIRQFDVAEKHFVIGMVNDKDISQVLALMPKDAKYYFAKADIPRGLP